jgi:hypothetical protein
VAISEHGPLLVEGNYLFGSEAPQVAHDAPLGQARYVACALHYVEQRGRAGV